MFDAVGIGKLACGTEKIEPRMPVPMETKRIFLSLGAARTVDSSRIDLQRSAGGSCDRAETNELPS